MNIIKNIFVIMIFSILLGMGNLVLNYEASAQAPFCDIAITKSASPADDTVFTFTAASDELSLQIPLSDPSSDNFNTGIEPGDSLTVTEEPLEGWELVNVECIAAGGGLDFSIEGPTVSIDCLDEGGEISCLYTNVQVASQVPTLSEWGLIAMAGILGIVGFIVARRRVTA